MTTTEIISVNWFGLELLEPMTFFTDILVAFSSMIFWKSLNKETGMNKYWELFFITIAISTFFGGFAHLLYQYFGVSLHMIGRSISGFGIFAAEMATLQLISNRNIRNWLPYLFGFQLVIFLGTLWITGNFNVVTINSVLGLMGFVLTIHLRDFLKQRCAEPFWIVSGLLVAVLAALANIFKLSLHAWFTHQDLSHLIMIISLFLMHKGLIMGRVPVVLKTQSV